MDNKEKGMLLNFLCWLSGYLNLENLDYLAIIRAWEQRNNKE